MTMSEIKLLLEKYKNNEISEEECLRLLREVADNEHAATIKADILETLHNKQVSDSGWKEEDAAGMLASIFQAAEQNHSKRRKRVYISLAAAMVAGIIALSIYISPKREQALPVAQLHPLAPGASKAMLTLGDGTTIPLDSASTGTLAKQGSTQIVNTNGRLNYKAGGNTAEVMYNKVVTPLGGQYQLTLADGSRVWLNAASSIRFPTAFTGKDRKVEISGEVYFEIAKQVDQPFSVRVNDIDVNVLGTSFNIMAYSDEQVVKTTLVEGAVQLTHNGSSSLLKPGLQASLSAKDKQFVISPADMEQTLAWKEGKFRFRNTNIKIIMRQLSRWYDMDVTYQGDVSDIHLTGVISRRENADKLLKALETTQKIHFEVNGNKITVMPSIPH
ncbi:FecR family protein [Chitinophaga sp. CF118]|uniref:FecR family protein n=1 Tax=Chitinophaga sp. CF118 TaxID=1884367 RepID=UPI0008F1958D|nr:FecR domain-containing protein [Chitinophaga sp. CF118]SFD08098.1 FecR family protein [Chitinophaga sp. CF118]